MSPMKKGLLALGLTVTALALSACGEDGGAEKRLESAGAALTKQAFCTALAKIEAPFADAGQYASREQKVEAAKKATTLLDATAKIAPPEIADAAKTRFDAIRTTAEGEPSKLIDSATLDATQKLQDYCPPASGG
jgi:hypothetical protein